MPIEEPAVVKQVGGLRGNVEVCAEARGAIPVGVATLHYGFNEGAVLQAFSVAAALEGALSGVTAEIVDHRYTAKLLAEGDPNTPRKQALRGAVDDWLPLSSKRFCADNEVEALAYIANHYRALVVGSDVLWRFKYTKRFGGLVRYQRRGFHTPIPNIYWPGATIKIPKFSFAASIGTSDWQSIPFWQRHRLRRIFLGFSLLSVRDTRTLRFLEWLDPELVKDATLVPDPTWCVDLLSLVDDGALRCRLENLGVDFSRPRCGFIARSSEAARGCAEAMKKRGYQVIGITTQNDFCDVRLFEHGFHPLEWARLFGFLDVCFSERMHGCIFCLQNGTPVVALDINETTGDPDTKLADLFRSFGKERFCLPKSTATSEQLVEACDEIEKYPWNWDIVTERIGEFRLRSEQFLKRIGSYIR